MKPFLIDKKEIFIREEVDAIHSEATVLADKDERFIDYPTAYEWYVVQLAAKKGYEKRDDEVKELKRVSTAREIQVLENGKNIGYRDGVKVEHTLNVESLKEIQKLHKEELEQAKQEGRNEAYDNVLKMSLLEFQIEHVKKLKEQGIEV